MLATEQLRSHLSTFISMTKMIAGVVLELLHYTAEQLSL